MARTPAYTGEERRQTANGIRFDKTINLGHLLTFAGFIFTILVGRRQRSLVQYFEPVHRPLMAKIPGIQAMRDKFR